jgi:hypothetical protein
MKMEAWRLRGLLQVRKRTAKPTFYVTTKKRNPKTWFKMRNILIKYFPFGIKIKKQKMRSKNEES